MNEHTDTAMDAVRASDLLPLVIRRITPFVTAFRELRRQWDGAGYTEPDDAGMLVGPDVTVGAYRRLCDLHRDLTGIVIDNAVTPRWKLVPMDLLSDLLSASQATSEDEWLAGVARVAEDLAVNALTFTAPPPAEVAGILAQIATLQDPAREWASIGERLEESLSTGRTAAGLITRLAKAQVAVEAGTDVAAQPTGTFQARVHAWMMACFGPTIAADTIERNHRFLEEALELVQACGCTAADAHQLVDYAFSRPVGERHQEVGGVMVTLAALCLAQGLDMHEAGETELARNWTKVEQVRAKQAAKPKGSPLPEPVAQQPQPAPAAAAALVAWLDEQDVILPDDPARLVPVPASLLRRLRSADSGGGAQQPAGGAPAGWQPTHRHRKGGLYRVITTGLIEADLCPCVVYDNTRGDVWIRPSSEFNDGRFTALPAPTCPTCGRPRVWLGSEEAAAGTFISEIGCHDGVAMDDDAYANGWNPNVIYPPCPHNPARCMACGGSGYAVDPEAAGQDDCPDCDGTGWRGGERPRWLLRTATSAGER